MTKEQLMQKWGDLSRPLKNDIDAVIEYEIAKSKEPQPANSFDKERFERMFRAVVASEAEIDFVFRRNETNYLLEQLDAYYVTKNN